MSKNKFDQFFKDNHFGNEGYWYLRLSNSFFDDSVMEEMLDFPMYGESFFIIFLKLCVKSLEKKGYIRIPQYFSEGNYSSFLAKNIKADPEKVRLAMEYFLTKNLI